MIVIKTQLRGVGPCTKATPGLFRPTIGSAGGETAIPTTLTGFGQGGRREMYSLIRRMTMTFEQRWVLDSWVKVVRIFCEKAYASAIRERRDSPEDSARASSFG